MAPTFNTFRFLLAVAATWGVGTIPVLAHGIRESLAGAPYVAPSAGKEKLPASLDDMARVPRRISQQKWASLSADERDQLRNQIREHWRQMTPEQRQRMRDIQYSEPASVHPERAGYPDDRRQRFTPDEREQFRQWIRQRHRGG